MASILFSSSTTASGVVVQYSSTPNLASIPISLKLYSISPVSLCNLNPFKKYIPASDAFENKISNSFAPSSSLVTFVSKTSDEFSF